MPKPHRAWLYALVALLGGVLFTAAGWFAGIGLGLFMAPAIPVMKALSYMPAVPPTVELGELPFSVHEAFLAFFYAAIFWVIVVPAVVWILAAVCLKRTASHAKHPSDA